MKLNYFFVAFLTIGSLVSCKKDNAEDKPATETSAKENAPSGKVAVIINGIVTKDDTFQLFYSETGSLDFDHNVLLPVKGKAEAQDITFLLLDDALPASMRIDPGDQKGQEKITINSVTVKYYDKSLIIEGGKEFLKYFQSDNIGTENATDKSVTLVTKEVNGSYDPMLYPTGELINALKGILVK